MARLFTAALVLGSLGACSFQHGSLTGDSGAGGDDAPRDTRTDTPPGLDACTTFSTHLDTCMPMVTPGGALVLSGVNKYDTDTQILTTPNGGTSIPNQILTTSDGEIVAVLVSSFTLSNGATLRITGVNDRRPFGIVSYGHVQIDGLIDLSDAGAGARGDTTCSDLGLKGHKGVDDNGGASGAGGGGFAGAGGGGADGDSDSSSDGGPSSGAAGGNATARPAHVLGGCDGGAGGSAGGAGGSGGHGGGAIFIASGNSITISTTGAINAGGGGGKAGVKDGGGGAGGGSGGMIVLESGTVSIMGKLAANGGGGGEGADSGNNGTDGTTGLLSTTRAAGGSGAAGEGGDGAGGGAGPNAAGQDATQFKKGGGGGGGGGVGFIAIGPGTPVVNNATISPQFAVWP